MSNSGTESDFSASSDVDFDDYGEFGYQLEPEYTEELRQMDSRFQDFIDNTQTHKCVTWGHNIYTVLHGEMIIYYQKH
jgi:hypothetical protein